MTHYCPPWLLLLLLLLLAAAILCDELHIIKWISVAVKGLVDVVVMFDMILIMTVFVFVVDNVKHLLVSEKEVMMLEGPEGREGG